MRFFHTDVLAIGEILARAADAHIMPRFRKLAEGEVRAKSSAFDLVTDADEAAERMISAELTASFRSALVIGEEAAGKDPSLAEKIATADLAFIIDPLDGTRNFVAGLPLFGMMVAATIHGEVACGVIYDPICRDGAFALRDQEAWMQGEGRQRTKLRVAGAVPVEKMDGVVATNFLPEPLRSTVNGNLSRLAMSSWLRCAAHEYRMAAAGHCHLLLYNKLMPWDHAAGWLIHREAGGYSAHFDGTEYRPDHFTGGLICAPDKASWVSAREALLGVRSSAASPAT
jgi:fructose-1,6-bisphosphatase/inositol monophosphatase family enzyme